MIDVSIKKNVKLFEEDIYLDEILITIGNNRYKFFEIQNLEDGLYKLGFANKIPLSAISSLYNHNIPKNIAFEIENKNENYECFDYIEISKTTIKFRLFYHYNEWQYNWNLYLYFKEVTRYIISNNLDIKIEDDFEDEYWALFYCLKPNNGETIGKNIERIFPKIIEIHGSIINDLQSKYSDKPLTAFFEFPEHLKTACEQYLMYFAQFLFDIGIKVKTEIQDIGSQILFSVIPVNKEEAISKISQALAFYLSIPMIDEIEIKETFGEISESIQFQSLASNILHLKAQLKLAEATLKLQKAHIDLLTNYPNQTNTNEVLINSLDKVREKDNDIDSLTFMNGIITIKKYEGKGFAINLPRLVSSTVEYMKDKLNIYKKS